MFHNKKCTLQGPNKIVQFSSHHRLCWNVQGSPLYAPNLNGQWWLRIILRVSQRKKIKKIKLKKKGGRGKNISEKCRIYLILQMEYSDHRPFFSILNLHQGNHLLVHVFHLGHCYFHFFTLKFIPLCFSFCGNFVTKFWCFVSLQRQRRLQ